MSALLDEIIRARKERALEYEEYLRRIAELVKQVESGGAEEAPPALDTPGKRALFNNLGQDEARALAVDAAVKTRRPDAWRGVSVKERVIKSALYEVLQDPDEVERIFPIIQAQSEY
jgi:type I restriction enzyme, R subunit